MNYRNQSLDVLRGVAVLMVIVCHYPMRGFMLSGRIGVDLFFVLSGFLISGLLFSELQSRGTIRLWRFWTRRGFKIYPTFYFFLALTALLFPSFRPHWRTEALFIQNYIPLPSGVDGWGHLWSLDIEEHFYLALPLLLLLLSRLRALRTVPWIAAGIAAGCFVLRILQTRANHIFFTPQTHLRFDGLFAGVALGYLYHYRREAFTAISRPFLLPLSVVFLAPALYRPGASPLHWSLSYTGALIGFSMLVLWAVPRKIPWTKSIGEIGQHSYSIYLWNTIVSMFFLAHPMTVIGFIGFVVTSISVGTAMSVIIEQPSIYIRERFFSEAQKATTGVSFSATQPVV